MSRERHYLFMIVTKCTVISVGTGFIRLAHHKSRGFYQDHDNATHTQAKHRNTVPVEHAFDHHQLAGQRGRIEPGGRRSFAGNPRTECSQRWRTALARHSSRPDYRLCLERKHLYDGDLARRGGGIGGISLTTTITSSEEAHAPVARASPAIRPNLPLRKHSTVTVKLLYERTCFRPPGRATTSPADPPLVPSFHHQIQSMTLTIR